MPTTVILGAGIVGLSTAHALSYPATPAQERGGHRVHLVEAAPELLASASGHAAGFLAKDWFAPAVAPLGALSFDMHRALAAEHNGAARWGYAESVAYSLDGSAASSSEGSASDTSSARASSGSPAEHRASPPSVRSGSGSGSSDSVPRPSGVDWLMIGASRSTVAASPKSLSDAGGADGDDFPRWVRARPDALQAISDRRTTAQVNPRQLCEFLLAQCLAAGVTLHQPARATRILPGDGDGAQVRIQLESSPGPVGDSTRTVEIPCDSLVIAAGCWTPQVYTTLFPNAGRIPRVTALAGHSLRLASPQWNPIPVEVPTQTQTQPIPETTLSPPESAPLTRENSPGVLTPAGSMQGPVCHAVFTDMAGFAPEIFSRATGDVWVGGLNSSTLPLPALPTDARVDPEAVAQLTAVARVLCGDGAEVRGSALCFRPVSATGKPVVARIHEADMGDGAKPASVFVATGHGPWGISLGLGTGRVVAEMVVGRETSADVAALGRWVGVLDDEEYLRATTP